MPKIESEKIDYSHRPCSRPAPRGKIKSVRTHSEVIEQFDSFSLLKLLFLVRNWHCWSRKAITRQMTSQIREWETAKTAVFRQRWQAWKVVRSIAAVRQRPRTPRNWRCSFAFFESFLWHFNKKQHAEVIFRLSRPVLCKNQENGSGKQWSLHAPLKTHMFALEVGCLGYCPHSFLHCFEALGLPKSAARQIRSEASKTALRSSYVLFLRRGMPTWECQAVLYWTMLTSRSFRFFFFFLSSFALPFPLCTVRTPRQLVPFPSIHTTPPRFSNSSTVRRSPYRHRTQLRTPVFRALPSGLNFRAASRLRSVSSSLRGLNDACAGRRLVDLCF